MCERILAVLIFIILLPLFILVTMGMLLEGLFSSKARGSIIHTEERISRGQPFPLYKFRTFRRGILESNAEDSYGVTAIEHHNENITSVGRILKKFYLDELPQIVNIIKGEMSFVGPRPLVRPLYEDYTKKGNRAKDILKAGWTGPWQSRKGYINSAEEIIKAENGYLEDVQELGRWRRFLYDAKIIFRTLRIILEAKGI